MNKLIRISTLLLAGFAAGSAIAQKSLPNPLIQPPKRGGAAAESPAGAEGGAGASQSGGTGSASSKDLAKDVDSVPTDLISRVSGLYVSAIIGDLAVLRTSSGGAAAAAGGGGTQPGQTGGAATGAGGGSRSSVYYIRDAEPFQIFDRFRLLPRIQDTTVVLYLMPDNQQDAATKRPQVVFRSTLDSLQSSPHIPAKLEGGSDAGAYQSLIQTGTPGSGGAKSGSGAGNGSTPK